MALHRLRFEYNHLGDDQIAALKSLAAGNAPAPADAAALLPFLAQTILELNQGLNDVAGILPKLESARSQWQ